MDHPDFDNVLLVCGALEEGQRFVRTMVDSGMTVTGPAQTASIAMTLAAQTAPTLAVIAYEPNGQYNYLELASDLYRTWGIRSWVMPGATRRNGDGAEVWEAPEAGIEKLRRVLTGRLA